ncbi:MAG TPA: tagaturonate epimerase family protein, partial [Anaerolineae bacterium]
MTFPFMLAELQEHFSAIYPDSLVVQSDAAFWLQGKDKQLAVFTQNGNLLLDRFHGDPVAYQSGYAVKLCPTDHANAHALRAALDWLAPKPIGLATSAGTGDRLGLATPGHVHAFKAVGGNIVPIFAQQSIREMQRT